MSFNVPQLFHESSLVCVIIGHYYYLYNNQINVRALIGQSAVVYCACKPTEKSHVF